MTLVDLKTEIDKEHKLRPYYIFTGDEIAIMDIYIKKINKLVTTSGGVVVNYSSVADVYADITTPSLFDCGNKCYIVRNDMDFLKQEKSWSSALSLTVLKHNTIIMVYADLDKRGKFYKQMSSNMVIFDKLPEELLYKYVYKELPLSKPHIGELIRFCGGSYNTILLECDKLKHLHNATHNKSLDEIYDIAIQYGFIHIPAEDAIFNLIDAILTRNPSDTYYYLDNCIRVNENPLAIISVLYNNCKALLQYQGLGTDKSEPCKKTGLTPYQIQLVKSKLNRFSNSELVNMLYNVREAEKNIKTGEVESWLALQHLLISIFYGG